MVEPANPASAHRCCDSAALHPKQENLPGELWMKYLDKLWEGGVQTHWSGLKLQPPIEISVTVVEMVRLIRGIVHASCV